MYLCEDTVVTVQLWNKHCRHIYSSRRSLRSIRPPIAESAIFRTSASWYAHLPAPARLAGTSLVGNTECGMLEPSLSRVMKEPNLTLPNLEQTECDSPNATTYYY